MPAEGVDWPLHHTHGATAIDRHVDAVGQLQVGVDRAVIGEPAQVLRQRRRQGGPGSPVPPRGG
eukprot:11209920-Lingulodinium_polyedra.AAC.1